MNLSDLLSLVLGLFAGDSLLGTILALVKTYRAKANVAATKAT